MCVLGACWEVVSGLGHTILAGPPPLLWLPSCWLGRGAAFCLCRMRSAAFWGKAVGKLCPEPHCLSILSLSRWAGLWWHFFAAISHGHGSEVLLPIAMSLCWWGQPLHPQPGMTQPGDTKMASRKALGWGQPPLGLPGAREAADGAGVTAELKEGGTIFEVPPHSAACVGNHWGASHSAGKLSGEASPEWLVCYGSLIFEILTKHPGPPSAWFTKLVKTGCFCLASVTYLISCRWSNINKLLTNDKHSAACCWYPVQGIYQLGVAQSLHTLLMGDQCRWEN